MTELASARFTLDTYEEGVELCYDRGWTDGLPVALPTPDKVRRLLEHADLPPDEVFGRIPERNRVITAEKAAINAVMAGCKPEYFPVVAAAIRAITAPKFEFNHLASMGSPTPVLIVSGPVVKQLGLNTGGWVLGPGSRANASIGRALSLVLWNCAELRPSAVLRGTYGNPLRWTSGCVAEDAESHGEVSLRQYLGFDATESTVTVHSNVGAFTQVWIMKSGIEDTLLSISDAIAAGSGNFNRGVYLVVVGPSIVHRFAQAGWSLRDVRDWLYTNTGRPLADLKRRGFPPGGYAHELWRSASDQNTGDPLRDDIARGVVADGDDERFIHLFAPNGEIDEFLWSSSQLTREVDIYMVVAGADVAYGCLVLPEYDVSTEPVTVTI